MMNKRNLDIAYFLSFCIEQYKKKKDVLGAEAVQTLKQYGVLEYLAEHSEVMEVKESNESAEGIERSTWKNK